MIMRSAILLAAALALALPAAASPVMVTVTGAVENTNRGPMDPDYDKLFLFTGNEFDAAHAFTIEMLGALPQSTAIADFPMGGPVSEFAGPTFETLLAAAGAEGRTVTIQALDGYAIEIPHAELVGNGAILAIARDGEPLGIGDFGPAMLVYPRAERPELAEMNDDTWIWQVFHVRVE